MFGFLSEGCAFRYEIPYPSPTNLRVDSCCPSHLYPSFYLSSSHLHCNVGMYPESILKELILLFLIIFNDLQMNQCVLEFMNVKCKCSLWTILALSISIKS